MQMQLVVNLNKNELDCPIKRQKLAEWINTENVTVYHLQETHSLEIQRHKWKKILHTDGKQEWAGVAVPSSDKQVLSLKRLQENKKEKIKILQEIKGVIDL